MISPVRVSSFVSRCGYSPIRSLSALQHARNSARYASTVSTHTSGELGKLDFRMKFVRSGRQVSPWHDIPLHSNDNCYNFITEIPRYTTLKMEINGKEQYNPISQDVKNGLPRCYDGPLYWNYGCLPQTWEDPTQLNKDVNAYGDNDPLDVVEIGSRTLEMGSISPVKVLGALAMIDSGELDWKLIAIRSDDPMAKELHDVNDVEGKLPGVISGIREWFRWYKTPSGKPLNKFGYDEKCLGEKKAVEVIHETHNSWKRLIAGEAERGKLWIESKSQ